MEQAIQKAGRAKYGQEKDIRAFIDRKDGRVKLERWTEVVEAEPKAEEKKQAKAKKEATSSPKGKTKASTKKTEK